MDIKRKISLAVAVLLSMGTLSLAASPAAATEQSSESARLALPSCIEIDQWNHNHLYVISHCTTSYNINVIWSGAPDSGCHTLTVGEREYHASRSPFAQFDEVRTC